MNRKPGAPEETGSEHVLIRCIVPGCASPPSLVGPVRERPQDYRVCWSHYCVEGVRDVEKDGTICSAAPAPIYHMTVWDDDRNSKGYYWGFEQVAQYLKDNPSHSVEVELMSDDR